MMLQNALKLVNTELLKFSNVRSRSNYDFGDIFIKTSIFR